MVINDVLTDCSFLALNHLENFQYNEHLLKENQEGYNFDGSLNASKKSNQKRYEKVDSTFYPEKIVSGFIGFELKPLYNFPYI